MPERAESDTDKAISDNDRNGSITALGIVLGFSLAFLGQWSLTDGDWKAIYLLPFAITAAGAGAQLYSLLGILHLPSISISKHRLMVRWFIWGVALVIGGFVAHVAVDYLETKF